MEVFLAWKVHVVQVAYAAVSAVAADEPRSLNNFFRSVGAADCSGDRVGPPGNSHKLGLALYFDVVGLEQPLQR